MRAVRVAGAAGGIAVLLRLLYGPAHAGYDAMWALVWGRSLARGESPAFDAPVAPTPHPLSNVVSAALSLLGEDAALTATLAVAWLALGGLVYACFALGRVLFAWPVGAVAALVVATRTIFANETTQAIVDVPFLALVLAAAVLVARDGERSRREPWVPLLLLAAGLLRPEGWVVAAAWVAWARPPLRALALVAAAPVAWAAFDLAVTGDPLHSLHGTRELAAELDRPREADTALAAAPAYLRRALDDAAVWVGFAGAAAGLVWLYDRSLLPGALLVIGLVTFLVLGIAGLPLLVRYLLLPALALALFCGVAVAGWTAMARDDPRRRPWQAAGALAGVVLLAGVPAQVDRLRGGLEFGRERRAIQADLERLVARDPARAAIRDCGPPHLPDHRARPVLAYRLDVAPASLRSGIPPTRGPSTALAYATPHAADVFSVVDPPPPSGPGALPDGLDPVARSGSWLLAARC